MTLDDLITRLCELRRNHALLGRADVVFDATKEEDEHGDEERHVPVYRVRAKLEQRASSVIIEPENPL